MASPHTAYEIAVFYTEVNPLTQKQRFHHMEPTRVRNILVSCVPNLGPNGKKVIHDIEKAVEEIDKKLLN